MRRTERAIVYSLLGLCVLGAVKGLPAGATANAAPHAAAPAAATLATCDVYALVEKLLDTETFSGPRKGNEDLIKSGLAPIEEELNRLQTELGKMQEELQKANPQDAAAQAKAQAMYTDFTAKRKAFEDKVQPYNKAKNDYAEAYAKMVSGQFVQAYEQVCTETTKVANEMGYGYVISQKIGKITANDPRRLVEDFLSRPVAVQPSGSDITEAVRVAMKLPEKAPEPKTEGVPEAKPETPAVEKK